MKIRILAIGLLFSMTLLVLAQSGQDLFQRALGKEQLGDYQPAIEIYERIVQNYGRDRALVAKALVHLGRCYESVLGTQARKYYTEVIDKYPDQLDMVADARRRLNALNTDRSSDELRQHLVATGDDADRDAFITPDGRFLVRSDGDTNGVAVRDLVAHETKQLNVRSGTEESNGTIELAMPSPDLRWIVYLQHSSTGNELRIMSNETGGKARVLIAKNREYNHFEPAGWSADGKRILVTGVKADQSWELAWVSRDGGEIQPLKFLGWRLSFDRRPPSISPDGKYIAYSALAEDPGKIQTPNYLRAPGTMPDPQHIYVLRADGSEPETELVKGANINENPVWTPDGKRILFVSNRSGSFALWSVGVENGKALESPSIVRANIPGRITPIGLTLAGSFYYIPERANSPGNDIFLAQIDPNDGKLRGTVTRLLDNFVDSNRSPAWSPDGKFVAFKRRRPGNDPTPDPFDLVVHDLNSGIETKFPDTRLDGAPPVWLHDGKGLLTRRNYDVRPISLVDLRTGAMRSVEAIAHATLPLNSAGPIALSPDDKTLYLALRGGLLRDPKESTNARQPNWSIVSFDLVTGEQKQVWTSGSPLTGSLDFAVSPDGRSFALTFRRGEWTDTHLLRVDIDGSNPSELASSVSSFGTLAWTPNGRGIFYAAPGKDQFQLMRIPAEGGRPEFTGLTLGAGSHALSVSPDGTRILYSDSTSTGDALWAIDNLSSLWATPKVSASRK
jgi:Tol biopolymer transport system component